MYRSSHSLVVAALALCAGCASESAPASPSGPATPSVPAATSAVKESPLAAAKSVLANPLPSQVDPSDLLERADALTSWAATQPPESQLDVALTAGRLQLIAIVMSRSGLLLTSASHTALRRIATHPALTTADGDPALQVREAALAILGLDVSVKDVRINRTAALELAASPGLAGQAVRVAWLARAAQGLRAWATLPAELRAAAALPLSGRMLCPRCSDAHHITPDKVVPLLLGAGNAGGLICDQGIAAGASAKDPSTQIGALSLCHEFWPPSSLSDPALFWGMNAPVIGLLRTAKTLVQAAVQPGPLNASIQARIDEIQGLLKRPWVLPTALVAASTRDPESTTPHLFIPNLGGAGLSTPRPPLGVVSMGPDGLRVGLRPTLIFEGDELVSISVREGLPAGGLLILSLEALRQAPRDAKGAIAEITSAINQVQLAATKIYKALGHEEPQAPGVTLAIDAESAAEDASRVAAALRAIGVEVVHVLKAASHGHTLPLMIRDEVAGTRTVLNAAPITAYEHPLRAVVHRAHVDLWAAEGASGVVPTAKGTYRPPVGTQLGYRGKQVARVRIPIADPEAGLTQAGLTLISKAATYLLTRDNAAPLMHVIAMGGSRAADVLLVARRFQERSGAALKTPHVFWPGTRCGGSDYKANRRTPSDCATGVSVAFSELPQPSSRGISSRPAGSKLSQGDTRNAELAPPASDTFCDKKDIRVAMNREKGSFRFCYQRELQSLPDLAGRVVLRFTIGTDGRPKGPSIASSTLGNKATHGCLLKTVKRMTFKPPKGGVCPVRWPFTFQPR
jgi:TonB family protein